LQTDIVLCQFADAMCDAVIVADPGGTVIVWNTAAERMFGFRKGEALGQLLMDLIIPKKQRFNYSDAYDSTIQTGKTRYAIDALQGGIINKDGHNISVELTVVLIYSSEKKVTGVAVFVRDEADCFNDARMIFSAT
jgi:PAS domain S-box-containing protein